MSVNNPEVERHLQVLTDMCQETLNGDETGVDERAEPILKSLLMSGYARNADTTLQAELESRVKAQSSASAEPHSEALVAVAGLIQAKFDKLRPWQSNQPEQNVPPKAAKISAATGA